MTKIRKNLKVGTELTYSKQPGRTAGYSDNVTVKKILHKGDHIDGFGTVEQDGYLVSGTRVQLFKDNVGRPESTTYIISMGEDLPNLVIYDEIMKIFSPGDGETLPGLVTSRKKISDEADLLMVHFEELEDIAVIQYSDGSYFTPSDWTGYQPECPENVDMIEWISNNGQKATILNGIPRIFPA